MQYLEFVRVLRERGSSIPPKEMEALKTKIAKIKTVEGQNKEVLKASRLYGISVNQIWTMLSQSA